MREASKEVVSSRRPRGVVALACMASLSLSAGPAIAQDVFGFLRLFSSPIPQGPAYQPYDHRPFPDVSGRTSRRPKKAARADPPASKIVRRRII
jgi:hypothetical protein